MKITTLYMKCFSLCQLSSEKSVIYFFLPFVQDPAKAIPLGTLLAIGITTVTYWLIIIITGFSMIRDASGNCLSIHTYICTYIHTYIKICTNNTYIHACIHTYIHI